MERDLKELVNKYGKFLNTKDEVIKEYHRIKRHIKDDVECDIDIDWWIENGTMENVEYWIDCLNKSKIAKINKLNFYYDEYDEPCILGRYIDKGE